MNLFLVKGVLYFHLLDLAILSKPLLFSTPCKANPKKISPRKIYKDFLAGWLAWIEGGSKRDKQGYPVIPDKKKEATVA